MEAQSPTDGPHLKWKQTSLLAWRSSLRAAEWLDADARAVYQVCLWLEDGQWQLK